MKTCVLYSGSARTISETWANQLFWLFRVLPKPVTVVASVVDDPQAPDMDMLFQQLPKDVDWHFEKVVQPTIPEPPIPCKWHSGYPPARPQGILKQLWHLNRVWEFAGETVGHDFDLFVRIRPDIAFLRFKMPEVEGGWLVQEDGVRYASPGVNPNMFWGCYWSKWGGVNDRFALMGRKAAEAFFTAFNEREAMFKEWCPLQPETMLGYALERKGITVDDTMTAEFIIPRLPGHKDGAFTSCDCSVIDIRDACRR